MEIQELIYKNMSAQIMTLRPKQNEAYSLMSQGKSIFLTGPAGSGKSKVIEMFAEHYKDSKRIAITSTTGTSALLIGGVTLHSYTGIGLGKGSLESITSLIFKRSYLCKRWNELEVLIIDEISMLSPELFDKLEKIAKIVRNNFSPFGGIQLIISGDFCQLPCIESEKFCNQATSWNSCIDRTIYLHEIIRQCDPQFQNCLNHIRLGQTPSDIIELLESRVGAVLENDYGIKPTKLYSLNYAVDFVNNKELDKLADEKNPEFFEYEMEITVYKSKNRAMVEEKFKKYCTAPTNLQLCVGAQVMLLHNLDLEAKLANGSRGVVVNFENDIPVVKFLDGTVRTIDYHIWEIEENDTPLMRAVQIPLKLAYAISIHKCCSGDTMIYTDNGLKKISKISSDLVIDHQTMTTEEISINVMGKTGYEEATQIYKGKIEKTIRLTTSFGYTIEGSYRHPLLIYDGEEKWKKLPEIKLGDYIVLKKYTECFGRKISTAKFIEENCKLQYNIPNLVDDELCYLIGLLIGNGCYSVKTNYPVEFFINKDCVDVKNRFVSIFESIFGINCNVYDNFSKSKYKLKINSKHVRNFLQWCGLDYVTSKRKTIPWVILENTYESQVECLKGLYDTNGGVNKTCVHYTTVSYDLAKDIQNILLNIGIISSLRDLNGRSRKKYRLYITDYQAHNFYNLVGFIDPVKQSKLERLYRIYNLDIIKSNTNYIPGGKEIVKQLTHSKYYKMNKMCGNIPLKCSKLISKIIRGKQEFRTRQLKYLYENLNNIEMYGKAGEKIAYLYKNNLFFDRIVKIEECENQLYDLYVPSDHTFIGNGIVNHNSQGCSLDYVEIDLSEIFEYGQAYVALSRVKSLEGLSLIGLDIDKIKAHPEAIEFYENLL